MAQVKAYYGIDMLNIDIWYGYVTVANSATIRIESGGSVGTYSGSFWYDSYDEVHGRLTGYTESYYGTTWVAATGIDRDARTFQSYIDRDDEWGALQYVLSGSDKLIGSHQDDTLIGCAGSDVLAGGWGNDRRDGGTGSDRALYTGTSAVTVSLGSTAAQNTGYGWDTLRGIEHLTSGSGNDRLLGNGAANSLLGGAGNDVLRGGRGNDSLLGGTGNDTLDGGSGDDLFDGGTGNDRAVFSGSVATVVNLGLSNAQNTGHGWDTLRGIEHLISGSGNDRLIGSGGENFLTGGAGNDVLQGGGGNDRLLSGTGNDALAGGWGNDRLDWRRRV